MRERRLEEEEKEEEVRGRRKEGKGSGCLLRVMMEDESKVRESGIASFLQLVWGSLLGRARSAKPNPSGRVLAPDQRCGRCHRGPITSRQKRLAQNASFEESLCRTYASGSTALIRNADPSSLSASAETRYETHRHLLGPYHSRIASDMYKIESFLVLRLVLT